MGCSVAQNYREEEQQVSGDAKVMGHRRRNGLSVPDGQMDRAYGVVDRLLNVHEAAAYLGLAGGSLYHMASQGRIPCIRLSRRCLRFRKSDLDRFIEGKFVPAK